MYPPRMGEGTRAFLFTDIEGSTRLWDESPDAMAPALARHDALVREVLGAHGGEVFKTMGDSFCVAFPSVPAALAAALDVQRALVAEAWPTPRPLRVRVAVHVGEAHARDGDYFGPTLNRTARLLVLAHGGQVLLSEAAHALAQKDPPPDVAFASLGAHRLRDLSQPETVFGLLAPDLPRDFPPLRVAWTAERATNLPEPATSFVGREDELRRAVEALGRTRLLTLTGPGGTGKTRLALRAASDAAENFPGGVWLVELAPLASGDLVTSTLAGVLGLQTAGGLTVDALAERLGTAPTLLVLDNCEHLLDAAARLADALVRRVPGLRVLATSREPLGVEGETVFRVPTLSLPEGDAVEDIGRSEAARLFVERATAHRDDFAVTPANAPAVASLCRRLDGLPLAMELAAARVGALGVEGIEARLDDRLRLLTGGSRTALPRQQTLRALVDWSYDLLNETERTILRRLAAFAGGWTLEAAEAVVAGEGIEAAEVLDGLASLVDKSLATFDGERYGMLHTVRGYAQERLREGGDEAATAARHAAFFAHRAAIDGARVRESGEALRRLTLDLDNLRAAMDRGTASQRLEMVGALRRFWVMRGMAQEGRERALAALREDDPPSQDARRLAALACVGALSAMLGEDATGLAPLEEGVRLADHLGVPDLYVTLLNEYGAALRSLGEVARAQRAFEEALRVRFLFAPLANLAMMLTLRGEFVRAGEAIERTRSFLRDDPTIDPPYFRFYFHQIRGRLLFAQGRIAEAERDAESAREIGEGLGAEGLTLEAWVLLGDCRRAQGRLEEAASIARRVGAEATIADPLEPAQLLWAQLAIALGRPEEATEVLRSHFRSARPTHRPAALETAASLLAATNRPREATVLLGASSVERVRRPSPVPPIEGLAHERLTGRLREALGEEAFATATAEGEALEGDAAKAFALAALSTPLTPPGKRGRG